MLHVGCGPIKLNGYTNIDIEQSHNPDICGDILTMDFEDVDVIYGCHFFEHLSYPVNAVKCLSLFYKWLKLDGVLRLAVPDLMKAAHAYAKGYDMRFLYGQNFKGYYYKDTPAERLNFFVKAWEHQMCYDADLLYHLLRDAGFEVGKIKPKMPNESKIPDFSHDRFISESIYVEAIK